MCGTRLERSSRGFAPHQPRRHHVTRVLANRAVGEDTARSAVVAGERVALEVAAVDRDDAPAAAGAGFREHRVRTRGRDVLELHAVQGEVETVYGDFHVAPSRALRRRRAHDRRRGASQRVHRRSAELARRASRGGEVTTRNRHLCASGNRPRHRKHRRDVRHRRVREIHVHFRFRTIPEVRRKAHRRGARRVRGDEARARRLRDPPRCDERDRADATRKGFRVRHQRPAYTKQAAAVHRPASRRDVIHPRA